MPITNYRERTLDQMRVVLGTVGEVGRALDFGSGDGFYCHHVGRCAGIGPIVPLDVVERSHSLVRPRLYDGRRIPFGDGEFELVYTVDVLHHCPDPMAALAELLRCTRRWLLIKDHNCDGAAGHAALTVLDELGNRRFGIPSPRHYQRHWQWVHWLEAQGLTRRALIHPVPCHVGVLGALTNRLQFLALWERT